MDIYTRDRSIFMKTVFLSDRAVGSMSTQADCVCVCVCTYT